MEFTKTQLEEMLCEIETTLEWLETRLGRVVKAQGRKEQVLACFEGGGLWSISELAKQVGITDRNISSQLSYLRADGYEFAKYGSGAGKLKLVKRPE